MNKILLLLIAVFAFTSCNNKKDSTMETSTNEKLVYQYFDYFNRHEWTKMAGLYAENSDFKDPSLGQGIVKQTRSQIIDKYSQLTEIFPNLHDEIIKIYPSGEKHTIVEFISTGTAEDNSQFELPICTIFTLENGMIIKDFSYFDNFNEEEK